VNDWVLVAIFAVGVAGVTLALVAKFQNRPCMERLPMWLVAVAVVIVWSHFVVSVVRAL
jgi:hypothetical protein